MYQPTPVGDSKSRVFIICLLAFSILTPIAITVVTASSGNATAGPTVNSVLGLIVNTLGDAPDPSLDGICDTDAGTVGDQCTLRAAIQEANNASSDDTIGFDAALNGGTITLGTALDAIDGNLTINGPGATLLTVARSAGPGTPDFRIFTINSSRVVTISGLTISNGLTSTGVDGGAILNSGTLTLTGCRLQDNESGGTGGAIHNSGTLNINDSTITGNRTSPTNSGSGGGIHNFSGTVTIINSSITSNQTGNSSTAGSGGFGGGIFNISTMTIKNSTISGNQTGAGIMVAGFGAGIFNGGTLTLTNSTISGNQTGVAFSSQGAGIRNSGTLTATNSTITNNLAVGSFAFAGGLDTSSGTAILRNTILAANFSGTSTPSDIFGSVDSSSSFNLIGVGGSGGLTNGVNGNQVGVADPRLGPLANNGGPTQTHAILAGSTSLDAGDNTLITDPPFDGPSFTDQRGAGFIRIADGPDADSTATVDIGSFEAQVWVEDISDRSINEDGSDAFSFSVGGVAAITTVTATSSNTTLVPNNPANIEVTGSGSSRTLTINPVANGSGTTTITVTVNSANGSMTDTFLFTVNAVNDPPTANPQSVVTNEDTAVAILLTGSDVETPSAGMTFTITQQPANGILSGTGNNRTYTPNLNFNGADSFKFTVTDTGDGASPSLTSAEATVSITVNSINDAPVNGVPGTQSVVENSTLTFSSANSNALSVSDVEATQVQVTLTATNGLMTLASIGGLSFTVGNGSDDSVMTFTGSITNINLALNGLVFTPTPGFNGAASIQIVTNDQSVSGSGGPLSDTDTVTINVLDGGTLAFSSATFTVGESGPQATITVNRSGGSNGEARIDFATSDGTATGGGTDYTAASGTLTFANGVTTQTFTVPINNDNIDEPNETVNLTLSNPQGSGALGTPATAVLTITDDDPTPSISINDPSVTEGNSGTVNLLFAVTLSNPSSQTITVNFATGNNTAVAPSDFVAIPTTQLTFNPLETSKQITVVVNGDTDFEPNETLEVNLSSPSSNATLADNQGLGFITNDDPQGGTIALSSATFSVNEDAGSIAITVNRTGTTTQAVTVDYDTSDMTASERSDYTTAAGTLQFPIGATSASFVVLVNMDSFVEGSELVGLTLSNPSSDAVLGAIQTATLQIDNVTTTLPNTIDDAQLYVIQHYHDFLNREPDIPGRDFWTNEITSCGTDPTCIEIKRINVSAAFFLSIEFQRTGFVAFLTRTAAFGSALPRYRPFERDTQALQRGFIFGTPGADAVLEANTVAFFNAFVEQPEFIAIFGSLTNEQYVDELIANTAVSFTAAERDALVDGLNQFTESRATVLRKVVEKPSFKEAQFNRAFVLMQYFGYLRRNPDDLPDQNLDGFNFWFDKLNQFNGNFIDAEMVKAFISSIEYRQRFGQ